MKDRLMKELNQAYERLTEATSRDLLSMRYNHIQGFADCLLTVSAYVPNENIDMDEIFDIKDKAWDFYKKHIMDFS